MKQVVVRACSWLSGRIATLSIGLIAVGMASAPRPAWAQWSGTSPVWTNSNVGIGTASPDQKVTVSQGSVAIRDSSGANGGQTLYSANTATSGVNYGAVLFAVGSGASANTAGYFSASGATWNFGVRIVNPAAGPNSWALYADATAPSYFAGNVGIGTTNPTYKLSVNGPVRAKEVIVETGWSDYVFHPSHRLQPLNEVAAYIARNHHLPGIPSEAEVKENGVSLGEMQSRLLAKIEELTLHLIQEHERNDRLEQQNREIMEKVARLHAQ